MKQYPEYDIVEAAAKAYLDQQRDSATFSTNSLAAILLGTIEPDLQTIYKGLRARQDFELAGYNYKSKPQNLYGKVAQHRIWHKSQGPAIVRPAKNICPTCGQLIPERPKADTK